MSLILAVDTTGEHGSLALLRDGALLEELLLHAPVSYSPVLYESLSGLLARHSVTLAQVDCFAAASGPGTFTGVRVALACVMGLAEAMGRPAVAVSNLKAVASYGTAPLRAVALDARRNEIYGALYDAAGHAVTTEIVTKLAPWLETLPEGVEEFLTNDLTLDLTLDPGGTRFAHARVTVAPRELAAAVARIAAVRFERGEVSDPAALDANYVRRSDAELSLKV